MVSRAEYCFDNITVSGENQHNESCASIKLTHSKIGIYKNNTLISEIPLSSITAIEVHQPIFGTNYIDIEHHDHRKTVLTFKGGGATDFAREFFRIREGHLETPAQATPSVDTENSSSLHTTKTKTD